MPLAQSCFQQPVPAQSLIASLNVTHSTANLGFTEHFISSAQKQRIRHVPALSRRQYHRHGGDRQALKSRNIAAHIAYFANIPTRHIHGILPETECRRIVGHVQQYSVG